MKHSGKRMFQNPILELLSKTGPAMMTSFHLILITWLLYRGWTIHHYSGLWPFVAVFLGGFVVWTFAEYMLHRYVFHFVRDNKLVQIFHYTLHGYHHSEPNDSNRLFMPPIPAALFLLAFYGLFYLIMGNLASVFLAGFEFGYLIYSNMHYRVHTSKPPKLLKPLWKHHVMHHFKYPDKAFGVSSRFWDRVFQTMPPEEHTGPAKVKA